MTIKKFFDRENFSEKAKKGSESAAEMILRVLMMLVICLLFVAAAGSAADNFIENRELREAAKLLCTAVPAAFIIIFRLKTDGQKAETLGLKRKNCVKYYAAGAVFGFSAMCAAVGAAAFFTNAEFKNGELRFPAVFAAAWMIQGAEEELLFRGFITSELRKKLPMWAAAVISSALFTAAHALNSGFGALAAANIFLSGMALSALAIRFDGIIAGCAFHSAWNMTQGCVFGLSVSGINAEGSAVNIIFDEKNAIFTGGKFGIEAGICHTAVMATVFAAAVFVPEGAFFKKFFKKKG